MSTQAPFGIEFPAVIDAANAAFLNAAEPKVGAAMRAVLVDDADHASGVAKYASSSSPITTIFFGGPSASGTFLRKQDREPEGDAATRPSACPSRFRSEIDCPLHGAWLTSKA